MTSERESREGPDEVGQGHMSSGDDQEVRESHSESAHIGGAKQAKKVQLHEAIEAQQWSEVWRILEDTHVDLLYGDPEFNRLPVISPLPVSCTRFTWFW